MVHRQFNKRGTEESMCRLCSMWHASLKVTELFEKLLQYTNSADEEKEERENRERKRESERSSKEDNLVQKDGEQ